MTKRAMYLFMALALLFCAAAAFNIYAWNDGRSLKAELKAERTARLTQRQQDEKQAKLLKVAQCRQSIPAIGRANIVIGSLRADARSRARQARALAKADPTPRLRRVHLSIAAQQDRRADALTDFPTHTLKSCDDLAHKLGLSRKRTG